MKELEIVIAPDGTVKASIAGIKGSRCKVLATELAAVLGEEVSFQPSSEYYEPELNAETGVEEEE